MREPLVISMATIRFISASIETAAAILMLRSGRVEAALRINGILGLVGPTILISVTLMGVLGLAGKLPVGKILLIFMGVYLIIFGSKP